MKKLIKLIICTTAAACLITACGKKPTSPPRTGTSLSSGAGSDKTQTQQPVSNIRVYISDIKAYAGDTIDYISAIQSAENMEIKRSMIYVDSSAVDTSTPGSYLAEYTFDYLGTTVSKSIKVTILANPNATTAAAEEDTTIPPTEESTQETSVESAEESSAQEHTEASEESAGESPSTQAPDPSTPSQSEIPLSTEPVRATVEQELPDAVITLTNGKTVIVKCTSAHYIVETFTDETYFEEDGFTFLTSELKVLFNTGDIQVIETVVTRVEPQTASETETSADGQPS